MKSPTFTVVIPTCFGGNSLERTIRNIRSSVGVGTFDIRVRADSRPIPRQIRKNLTSLGVELVENKIAHSQMYKIKQLLVHVSKDIVIITHDDVRFDKNAIASIVKIFKNKPAITMVGAHIVAERSLSTFEKIIDVGLRGVATMGATWNRGDNYLLANGRCLAFRTNHLAKMRIPESVVNGDAYLYFENKRVGGSFAWAKDAFVFIQNPKTASEHLRQSRRFLYSQEELGPYFDHSLDKEYALPRDVRFEAFAKELVRDPIYTVFYLGLLLWAKITQKSDSDHRKTLWKVNASTKG